MQSILLQSFVSFHSFCILCFLVKSTYLACWCLYREASGYCRLVCFLRGHGSCMVANVVPLSRLFIHSFDACRNIELPSTYKTREVSYLTLSFSHKEFEEKTGEITEKTVAKEQPGVLIAVKDSNLRNDELGHDSRDVPTSSNFMQFQFSNYRTGHMELQIRSCKINFPFHPFPISKV